jgi:hypothetical protein
MHKVLYFLLLVLVAAELKEDEKQAIKDMRVAVVTKAVAGLDRLVENRHEIYRALTGRELLDSIKVEHVDNAKQFLKDKAQDMAVGHAVRSTWDSLKIPLLVLTFILVGAALMTKLLNASPKHE